MDAIFVGIDVSQARLDVHVLPSGEAFAVARDGKGLEELVERLLALSPQLIAVEATDVAFVHQDVEATDVPATPGMVEAHAPGGGAGGPAEIPAVVAVVFIWRTACSQHAETGR